MSFAELSDKGIVYDYVVPVTSLRDEYLAFTQLYPDLPDCENPFHVLSGH